MGSIQGVNGYWTTLQKEPQRKVYYKIAIANIGVSDANVSSDDGNKISVKQVKEIVNEILKKYKSSKSLNMLNFLKSNTKTKRDNSCGVNEKYSNIKMKNIIPKKSKSVEEFLINVNNNLARVPPEKFSLFKDACESIMSNISKPKFKGVLKLELIDGSIHMPVCAENSASEDIKHLTKVHQIDGISLPTQMQKEICPPDFAKLKKEYEERIQPEYKRSHKKNINQWFYRIIFEAIKLQEFSQISVPHSTAEELIDYINSELGAEKIKGEIKNEKESHVKQALKQCLQDPKSEFNRCYNLQIEDTRWQLVPKNLMKDKIEVQPKINTETEKIKKEIDIMYKSHDKFLDYYNDILELVKNIKNFDLNYIW